MDITASLRTWRAVLRGTSAAALRQKRLRQVVNSGPQDLQRLKVPCKLNWQLSLRWSGYRTVGCLAYGVYLRLAFSWHQKVIRGSS